jgi:hypothetical protein
LAILKAQFGQKNIIHHGISNQKWKPKNMLQIQYYKDFASIKIVSTFVIATGITVICITINHEVLQP